MAAQPPGPGLGLQPPSVQISTTWGVPSEANGGGPPCRGAAIRFLLTRLYDWTATPAGALVTRKDPLEYLRKLRFFAAVEGPTGLGL